MVNAPANRASGKTVSEVDSISPDIGLKQKQRDEVAEKLSRCLATTYTLYLKTLFYHWNVTGPNFISLHKLFDKQYNALQEGGDEVAERIRALGHKTPGTASEFSRLTAIQEDKALPQDGMEMVRNLLRDHEKASQAARDVFNKADEVEDQVTADMMIERMAFHDEAAWMLRSTLE